MSCLRVFILAFLGAGALASTGCVQVAVWDQRHVSKPGMIFSESAVLAAHPAALGQLEPGRAGAGGAQPVGCSSCR
jgi:hypothetical protein